MSERRLEYLNWWLSVGLSLLTHLMCIQFYLLFYIAIADLLLFFRKKPMDLISFLCLTSDLNVNQIFMLWNHIYLYSKNEMVQLNVACDYYDTNLIVFNPFYRGCFLLIRSFSSFWMAFNSFRMAFSSFLFEFKNTL